MSSRDPTGHGRSTAVAGVPDSFSGEVGSPVGQQPLRGGLCVLAAARRDGSRTGGPAGRSSRILGVVAEPSQLADPDAGRLKHRIAAASRPHRAPCDGHSVETELVALDVLHHEARLVVVIGKQQPHAYRAERDQARAFGLEHGQALVTREPGAGPHVKMQPVLDDLALRKEFMF
jgi:hypothetical protein